MTKPAVTQTYRNHRRMSPIFHFFLSPLSLIVLITSIVHTIQQAFSLASLLIFGLALMALLLGLLARRNALIVQDRVIRTEEQLRHFMLTGQPLDARLSIKQLIALRFASDQEFPALAAEAAEKNLSPDAIKQAIRTWRTDNYRV